MTMICVLFTTFLIRCGMNNNHSFIGDSVVECRIVSYGVCVQCSILCNYLAEYYYFSFSLQARIITLHITLMRVK